MTEPTPIMVAGFQISAVENGYIITASLADEDQTEMHFVAIDKPALIDLITGFIGQMPNPTPQQAKETRQ